MPAETAALKQEQRGGSGAGPLRAAARGGMAAADGAGRKRQRGRQLKEEGDDPEIVDLTDVSWCVCGVLAAKQRGTRCCA